MSQKAQKQPKKSHAAKPRSTGSAVAPMSKGTSKNARWSVGATWDGFGVKAGLNVNSRSLSNPNTRSSINGPVYCHSEVIATLTSPPVTDSVIAVVHTFQPGMETMFPWLSNAARGYQQYRVLRARYRYEPFTSVFGEAGKQGRVSLFFDYDVTTPIDNNIDDLLNKSPSINIEAAVPVQLVLNPKFMIDNTRRTKNLRTEDQNQSTNLPAFDAGRLILGLDQFTGSTEFGKLWVDYEVEFVIPSSQKVSGGITPSAVFDTFNTTFTTLGANTVPTVIGANWNGDANNSGNCVISGNSPNQVFLLEEGSYLCLFQFSTYPGSGNSFIGYDIYFNLIGVGNTAEQKFILSSGALQNVSANYQQVITVPSGSLINTFTITLVMHYTTLVQNVAYCKLAVISAA